jgi:hypothetical protein
MRHHIEHLSSTDMAWTQVSAGVYTKMLNYNEADGDRTVLIRFVPAEGAAPPSVIHYHSAFEEIFILDGKMTFDGQTWLDGYAYVFHPPFVVHGFKSSVPEETVFLARAPTSLDFNFPEPTGETRPYLISGEAGTRDLVYANVPDEADWTPLTGASGAAMGRQFMLSRDRLSGEGSRLVRLAAGLEIPARPDGYESFDEGFLLEGRVEAEDGTVWRSGDYWHRLAGRAVPALRVEESALVFLSTGPRRL